MGDTIQMTDFHGLTQTQTKQPHIDPRHLEAATRRIPVHNSLAKRFISMCEVVGSEASIKVSLGIFIGLRVILIEAFNVRNAGTGLMVGGAIAGMIISSCRAWAMQYKRDDDIDAVD